jgi:hypothetical protein
MLGYIWIKTVRTTWPSVLPGSGLQRDQSKNLVVINYKNAANATYSMYQIDQVNLTDNINDFIVETCTVQTKLQCRALWLSSWVKDICSLSMKYSLRLASSFNRTTSKFAVSVLHSSQFILTKYLAKQILCSSKNLSGDQTRVASGDIRTLTTGFIER